MNKNTDPKKLDKTNEGDAAVLNAILPHHGRLARFEWRTGPAPEIGTVINLTRAKL